MQKKIIIYQGYLSEIGGVETFLYNWCYWLRNYYDILLLYTGADFPQLSRLQLLVNTEEYDNKKKYECDIFIRNAVWGERPYNIHSKEEPIEMRHANYKFLQDNGKLKQQYSSMDIKRIVACGEYVAQMSHLVLGDNPTPILNILAPKRKTNKIYRFISCTRIDSDKGWDRMKQMMDMMEKEGIKYQWDIFTSNPQQCDHEFVYFHKSRYDIWDYIANADYCVLLSSSEGLPYTVQEALQYQVPCIVTDVGGCTELIKDGINGYVVPLDMKFDIKRILNIPKCKPYDNHALEKWLKYLGNSEFINKNIDDLEGGNFMIELEVIKSINYSNYDSIIKIIPAGVKEKGKIFKGDIITVKDEKEAKYLCGENKYHLIACKILRVIKEEKLETATIEKPKTEKAVKKTNVRTKKVLQK